MFSFLIHDHEAEDFSLIHSDFIEFHENMRKWSQYWCSYSLSCSSIRQYLFSLIHSVVMVQAQTIRCSRLLNWTILA